MSYDCIGVMGCMNSGGAPPARPNRGSRVEQFAAAGRSPPHAADGLVAPPDPDPLAPTLPPLELGSDASLPVQLPLLLQPQRRRGLVWGLVPLLLHPALRLPQAAPA